MPAKKQLLANSRRGRGRPAHTPGEKKQPHNMALSAEAWRNLQNISSELGFNSVSGLIENIGLRKVTIEPYATVAKNTESYQSQSIHWKIKFLLKPPSAVFISLVAFVARMLKQHKIEGGSLERRIADILKSAITVIFFVGHLCPERYFNNPSAYIRAIAYQIIKTKYAFKKNENSIYSSLKLSSLEIKQCIHRVRNMLRVLESARSRNYSVLKMKVVDNLTWGQIVSILALQGESVTEQELRLRVKIGQVQLRDSWGEPVNNNFSVSSHQIRSPIRGEEDAYDYIRLLSYENSSGQLESKGLEEFLFDGRNDVAVDYWINEIDYYLGFIHNTILTLAQAEKIREIVDCELDAYLERKIVDVNKSFGACTSRDDIHQLLRNILAEEGSPSVHPEILFEEIGEVDAVRSNEKIDATIDRVLDSFMPAVKATHEFECARDSGNSQNDEDLESKRKELEQSYSAVSFKCRSTAYSQITEYNFQELMDKLGLALKENLHRYGETF